MDQKIRKLMIMIKVLHGRHDVDRIYVSRKGERGIVSIEDSVNAPIRKLEDYIKSAEED